jgi:hypothetical protein
MRMTWPYPPHDLERHELDHVMKLVVRHPARRQQWTTKSFQDLCGAAFEIAQDLLEPAVERPFAGRSVDDRRVEVSVSKIVQVGAGNQQHWGFRVFGCAGDVESIVLREVTQIERGHRVVTLPDSLQRVDREQPLHLGGVGIHDQNVEVVAPISPEFALKAASREIMPACGSWCGT